MGGFSFDSPIFETLAARPKICSLRSIIPQQYLTQAIFLNWRLRLLNNYLHYYDAKTQFRFSENDSAVVNNALPTVACSNVCITFHHNELSILQKHDDNAPAINNYCFIAITRNLLTACTFQHPFSGTQFTSFQANTRSTIQTFFSASVCTEQNVQSVLSYTNSL